MLFGRVWCCKLKWSAAISKIGLGRFTLKTIPLTSEVLASSWFCFASTGRPEEGRELTGEKRTHEEGREHDVWHPRRPHQSWSWEAEGEAAVWLKKGLNPIESAQNLFKRSHSTEHRTRRPTRRWRRCRPAGAGLSTYACVALVQSTVGSPPRAEQFLKKQEKFLKKTREEQVQAQKAERPSCLPHIVISKDKDC